MSEYDLSSPSATRTRFLNWLQSFNRVMVAQSSPEFRNLFEKAGYWKDILAYTWEHRTFSGPEEIERAFAGSAGRVGARNFRLAEGRSAPLLVRRMGVPVIEAYLEFDTTVGKGVGFVRLHAEENSPSYQKIWVLLTTLHELKGHEEKIGQARPTGDEFSKIVSPFSWSQIRERERSFVS